MFHPEQNESPQGKFDNLNFNKVISSDEAIRQIAQILNMSESELSDKMPKLKGYQYDVVITQRHLSGGIESIIISPSGNSWSYTILDNGKVRESYQYQKYFQDNSIEEGLYKIFSDVANGKLQPTDLRRMSEMYLNNFPPVEYFYLHSDEFTAESCKKMFEGVDSPEAFKATKIYKKITTDPFVIERFKKVSIRIFTPSDAILELSKLTGKDAEQLAIEMPKLKEQKRNVELHRFKSKFGERDYISLCPAGLKAEEEPAWEYFIYLDNGEVRVWLPKTEKVSGKKTSVIRNLKKVKDLFLSQPQFNEISFFVEKHKDKSVDEIKTLLDQEASKNEFFKGVKKVEKKETRNGKEAIVLTVEKDHFPSTIRTDTGCAYVERGVVFIRDGLSDISRDSLIAHELYHIDHAKGSISGITHEIETIIAGELTYSIAGYINKEVEKMLDTPGYILRLIKQIRINARILFPGPNLKK